MVNLNYWRINKENIVAIRISKRDRISLVSLKITKIYSILKSVYYFYKFKYLKSTAYMLISNHFIQEFKEYWIAGCLISQF